MTALSDGAVLIRNYVKTLPDQPGVYRMLDENGGALYVGKAKNLKKRVVNYTRPEKLPYRLQRMISLTTSMEFVTTHTEAEALLLESNLIKKLKPRYNILLRDDKSFPYILLTGDHDFPQVTKHRGGQKRKGEYFGPFASAGAVNKTLNTLQRIFMLRNCSDSIFSARSRPCLQYHIKRCTAPCVEKISRKEYLAQVRQAKDFLVGKSHLVQQELAAKMQDASDAMEFEEAAQIRDRIHALTAVQGHQDINVSSIKDADVVALHREQGQCCIQVFFFRGGQNFGNHAYFPRHDGEDADGEILTAFLAQFYDNKPVPRDILLNIAIDQQKTLLEEAFAARAGKKIVLSVPERGDKRRLVDWVYKNAVEALARHMSEKASQIKLLHGVATLFGLDAPPERIEIYDNSHISGTNMVGAMVVAGSDGFIKNAYRKFNIKKSIAGDDFGMMHEVMERRFRRALEEGDGAAGENWPDLLLIDGGQGQLSSVMEVLDELGISSSVTVVAISKGPDRNAGREKFHMRERDVFQLPVNDPILHYLQRLRDEAHHFAITSHRARRKKDMKKSPLDSIAGIGPKRKKILLHHFGSAKAVSEAGVHDLESVDGISLAMAQQIYDIFHMVENSK